MSSTGDTTTLSTTKSSEPSMATSNFEIFTTQGLRITLGEEKVARGRLGVVYLGLVEDGSLAAVRHVPIDHIRSEWDQGCQEHIRLLCSMRHANLVWYLGASVEADTLFIAMVHGTGGTLQGLRILDSSSQARWQRIFRGWWLGCCFCINMMWFMVI